MNIQYVDGCIQNVALFRQNKPSDLIFPEKLNFHHNISCAAENTANCFIKTVFKLASLSKNNHKNLIKKNPLLCVQKK